MIVLRTVAEVRWYRKSVGEVGFVPTMGALHEGHARLMEVAVAENDVAIGSIFVNPLQFGANEDLSKYPRSEEEDIALAARVGVQAMFCPGVEEMVGANATSVSVRGVSELFEGERRPGHFDGVATIVAQLFGIIQPDRAYFGLKDLQQCSVIGQMVRDLCMPIDLQFIETVREESGLALSSRNAYFTDSERAGAANLNQILHEVGFEIRENEGDIMRALTIGIEKLTSLDFDVEYLELVDPTNMRSVRRIFGGCRLVVAARYCGVRLIDNISLSS